MPSSLSATFPTPAMHGFQPAFFTVHAPDPAPLANAPRRAGKDRISYDPNRHGSHAEFCTGQHFPRYREEMAQNLEFIIARCKQLEMRDAATIEHSFRLLYRHRFDEAYFDTHDELIDGAGKRALDNFCAMLDDPRLPPERQRTAILDLSKGITECASGAVANLIVADRDLSLSMGGLRGRLWQAKEDITRAVLRHEVCERYGGTDRYEDWEIHFVDAIWNYIANAVGLNCVPDYMFPAVGRDFADACLAKVLDALAPDKLAGKMAEDCLSEFRSRTVFDPASPSVPASAMQTEWLNLVLHDILRDLGLTERELNLHAFARLDDESRHYHLRDDPSLIALAFLRQMDADRLLASGPDGFADVVDQDGHRIALYAYGTALAWRLRQSTASAAMPSWQAQNDVDTMDAAELRAWLACQDPGSAALPPAALEILLRDSDPLDLMRVRAETLGTAQAILAVLQRLDPNQAATYLGHNLPYLLSRFPADQRAALMDGAIDMGEPGLILARTWYSEPWLVSRLPPARAIRYLKDNWTYLWDHIPPDGRGDWVNRVMHLGAPGRAFARAWYADPWALLLERHGGVYRNRLNYWIASNNAGAIDAVRALVGAGWPVKDVPADHGVPAPRAGDFHDDDSGDTSTRSVAWKCPDALAALQRLLRQLADGPAARGLALLFPVDAMRIIESEDEASFAALRDLLVDPRIAPHIASRLPTLLLDSGPYRGYPMARVLATGKPSLVRVYGDLLIEMAAVPKLRKRLPGLLLPKWPEDGARAPRFLGWQDDARESGYDLADASEEGAIDVIRVYHAILVHPRILPHIGHAVPELVMGRQQAPSTSSSPSSSPSSAQPSVLRRLFHPDSPGYEAYLEMAGDPLLRPYILAALPSSARSIRTLLAGRGAVDRGGDRPRSGSMIRHRLARFFNHVAR